jgi:hypothetical protein
LSKGKSEGVKNLRITGSRALDALITELMERGIKPGERLLSAVEQAVTSRPAAWGIGVGRS